MSRHRIFLRKPRGRITIGDIDLRGASENLRSAVVGVLRELSRGVRPSLKAPRDLLRYERDVFCRVVEEILRLHDRGEINQSAEPSSTGKATQTGSAWPGDDVSEGVFKRLWKQIVAGKRIDDDLLESLSPRLVRYLLEVADEFENVAFREQAAKVIGTADMPLLKPQPGPARSWKEAYILRRRNGATGSSGGVHTIRGRLH